MSAFPLRDAGDLLALAGELGCDIPWRDDTGILFEEYELILNETCRHRLSNRLAVHPMEGFDAEPDGAPGDLARRRYLRYAAGGSGLIWFEATAVTPEGRSNPRQLQLTESTVDGFTRLVDDVRERAAADFGPVHEPVLVLQLTHSGRFSRPDGSSHPLVAAANPHLDERVNSVEILTDDDLGQLLETFVEAAALAARAGFDAVDIKACHGYLLHDLLAARTRTGSRFGGPAFDDRARFLLEVVAGVGERVPEIGCAARISLTDGLPFPHGFGTDNEGHPDLDEPHRLLARLTGAGCRLLNTTAGVPSAFPWLGRPHDRPAGGGAPPPEHPLQGVARLLDLARSTTGAHEGLTVVGTGLSWLRHLWPGVAAGMIAGGRAHLIGLGRSSFAYPEAPRELADRGTLDRRRVCVACSRCTELMRHLSPTGCAVHDEYYRELYQDVIGS